VGLAVASAIYMAVLYSPFEDPSAAYFNTFARASGLLLGAMLAMVWAPWRERRQSGPGAGAALDITGVLGLAIIVWFLTRVNAFDSFIYRGGFFLLDLVCIVVIAVVVHPSAWLGRVLGVAPLQWLGRRSYSIYLWHWPIFMVTRPGIDVPLTGTPLFVLRITLTMIAAELSYRYIEQPIRAGALGAWWENLRHGRGERRVFAVRQGLVIGGIGLGLTVLIAWGLQKAASDPARDEIALDASGLADDVAAGGGVVQAPPTAPSTSLVGNEPSGPTTTIADATSPEVTAGVEEAADAGTGAAVRQTPTNSVMIGDSVVLGAQQELKNAMPGLRVDAEVSRQFDKILSTVKAYAAADSLPGPLIVNAGTNGTFEDDDLDRIFELVPPDHPVLLVNAKVDRPWESLVNERIVDATKRHRNAVLVDWFAVSEEHADWFTGDGTHLNPMGARAFAELIRDRMARVTGAPTSEPAGTGSTTTTEPDGSSSGSSAGSSETSSTGSSGGSSSGSSGSGGARNQRN
jgi:uncharacterized membrane protein YgcG